MGLLNVIRRMALREQLPIREIARRTGLSRNTIRKYLKAGTIEPKFAVPERPSKLDPFADKLAGWLRTETAKSRKQRRSVKQLHADLVALGYTGSYNRVAAFAREWRTDRQREQQTTGRGTFVPLAFRPGEAFQFDWSEDYAVLGGERTKLQVAHMKLSHSRAFLVRAYLLQTHEMLFDAHWHGFRVFGGVPGRGIYDNMKTAVDRIGRGKERQVNARFLAMANHYVFEPEFCNPASGWEKGQVEKNVQDARPRLWQPMPNFPDLAALNAWLERRCLELWREWTCLGLVESGLTGGLPFELGGADEVERRVAPDGIVEAVDVAADGLPGLGPGLEDGAPDQLGLQRLEEGLDHGVVVAVPLPGHRDQEAMPSELGLIVERAVLAATIRVVDQSGFWASDGEGLPECFKSQLLVKAVADGPANDAPGEQVDDDGEIQPALTGPEIADIGTPLLVGVIGREVLGDEVRRDWEGVKAVGRSLEPPLLPGSEAVLAH
jgi:transposase